MNMSLRGKQYNPRRTIRPRLDLPSGDSRAPEAPGSHRQEISANLIDADLSQPLGTMTRTTP